MADCHARVTAIILQQLETADAASWTPPWHGTDPLPTNALTGRRYRGLNVLALWCAAQACGYTEARWATYRQWAALGAQVRRGERGTAIVFYRDREAGEGGPETEAGRTFIARASSVFNVAQVDGAPPLAASQSKAGLPAALPAFMDLVAATGARITEGGTRACYVPATDTIHLPPRDAFRTSEGHAGTLAHELVHWTGALHRLARDLSGRFGARPYAAEELVAELGAAFVLAEVGVARTPHPDHAAYMASWLPILRADPQALSVAAAQGSRAAAYLVGLTAPEPFIAPIDRPAVLSSGDGMQPTAAARWTCPRRSAA